MAIKINGDRKESSVPQFVRTGDRDAGDGKVSSLVARGLASKKEEFSRDGRLYASDAGFCPRKAVLKATNEGVIDNAATFVTYCELGNTIEDLVLSSLYETGNLLYKQYKVPDIGINLGGKIDGLIVLDGKIRVLEIKSCGALPTAPKQEQLEQALLYSAITNLPATLLYFSRNVADRDGQLLITEFPLEGYFEERKATVFRAAQAYYSLRMGVLPSIPYHLDSERDCGYCEFIPKCWHGERFKTKLRTSTSDEEEKILAQTTAFMEHLLDPDVALDRAKGILNHVKTTGNPNAKRLLSGDVDWSKFM